MVHCGGAWCTGFGRVKENAKLSAEGAINGMRASNNLSENLTVSAIS